MMNRSGIQTWSRVLSVCVALALGTLSAVPASRPTPLLAGDLKEGQFLKRWLILGPIPTAPDVLTQAFARDFLVEDGGETGPRSRLNSTCQVLGEDLAWKPVQSATDIVDLGKELARIENGIAYAWTEVVVAVRTRTFLALGSDDGLKAWINGKPVHETSIERPLQKDDDLVPIELEPGTNQVQLKIQNLGQDWGFTCRFLGQLDLAERLVAAAARGDWDRMESLLGQGLSVNATNRAGLTAFHAASIQGYRNVARFLIANGAETNLTVPPAGRLIDDLLGRTTQGESAGAAILVAQDGWVLFKNGYGCANLAHDVPVKPNTRFRIGSITKQFTAAAILQLQEAGRLDVTNPISLYFPDFPRGDEVTLRHLLNHTSGIRSYTDKPGFLDTVAAPVQPDTLIASFQADPFDFSPGDQWRYSNSGYFLLGRIIEKVSGQTYEDYLKTQLLLPTGMTNSGVHNSTDILKSEAAGYAYLNGQFQKARHWDMSRAGAAGAIYSTVEDLYRWNEAIFKSNLLSKASLKAAFTPARLNDGRMPPGPGYGYGYGWVSSDYRGLKEIQHSGAFEGFASHLARYPDQNLTVVVLANASPAPPGLAPARLAREIAQIYLWKDMQPRTAPTVATNVSPDLYNAYLGRYDFGQGAVLTVTREGNRLLAQLTGQPRLEVFPKSDTDFFWKQVDAEISFVKDSQGRVTKAIHRQDDRVIETPKLPELTAVPLDPLLLDDYVGKYDYGQARLILTVTRQNDRLFVQMTGQPKCEIHPKSETEFSWQEVQAQITFVKDSQGRVTHAIHQQAGQTLHAPKLE